MPRATRPADHRLIGGVATGLAQHLSVPVLWVRIAFVAATFLNGAGVIGYLVLWRVMPLQRPERGPGLDAATRGGLRSAGRPGGLEIVQTVAVLVLGAGLLVLLGARGAIDGGWLVPLLVVLVGVALVWRQLDDATWASWMTRTSGWTFVARVAAGLGLAAVGVLYLVTVEGGFTAVRDLGSALGVAIVGLLLLLGPWIGSLVSDLGAERRERIRSQERADVAAHLHDSVLQTLALLQKSADDPATVATLARRQERELRAWLFGEHEERPGALAAALRAMRSEVEGDHRVPVEVVVVGDADLDPGLDAVVGAAREAVVNAAKHSGAERVDVYAEVGAGRAEVFVRDRGRGFDPAMVPDDRLGVRHSIVQRVERHGGSARVRSAPGEGTEVALSVPVSTPTASPEPA